MPERIEDVDERACLRHWLEAAEELDLVATALELDRLTGRPGAPPADPLRTALLHLLAGDPQAAGQALPPGPSVEDRAARAADPIPDERRALLKACLAARSGDQAARAYVRGYRATVADRPAAPERMILALTAEGCADLAEADELWLELAGEALTPVTVPRAAVALVHRRTGPVHEQARLLTEVAQWFEALVLPPARDPGPVLLAARLLVERDDRAGAALLVHAVIRRNLPDRRIGALEQALRGLGLRPDGRRRLGRRAILLGTDRRVRRALLRAPMPPMRYVAMMHAVLGVAVLIAAVAFVAVGYVADQAQAAEPVSPRLFWAVLVAGLIAWPLAVGAVLGRLLVGPPGRWWPRRAPAPHVPHCRCLTASAVLGSLVPDYLQMHLTAVEASTVVTASSAAGSTRSRRSVRPARRDLRVCPTTGVLWLVVGDPDGQPGVLLRGAVPAALEPQFPGASVRVG